MHPIPVKARFLTLIAQGKKTVEVHVLRGPFKRIRPGDYLLMFDSACNVARARVLSVRTYRNARELVEGEDPKKILGPGATKEQLMQELRRLYNPRELEMPMVAIEFELADFCPSPFERLPTR